MTEERRQDPETRERVSKLEFFSERIHEDFDKIQNNCIKCNDSYADHLEQNNKSFSDINQTLTKLTAALESTHSSISDLKDTSKNLVDTQQKLLAQFSLIELHNKQLEKIQDDTEHLKEEIASLKSMEASAKASWKTLTIVATIVAFLVSTAISIASFQLGSSSTEKSTKTSSITKYIDQRLA